MLIEQFHISLVVLNGYRFLIFLVNVAAISLKVFDFTFFNAVCPGSFSFMVPGGSVRKHHVRLTSCSGICSYQPFYVGSVRIQNQSQSSFLNKYIPFYLYIMFDCSCRKNISVRQIAVDLDFTVIIYLQTGRLIPFGYYFPAAD